MQHGRQCADVVADSVQYMIEVLMQVRKDKFKDNPAVPEDLDLVEEDDQITHMLNLEDVRATFAMFFLSFLWPV